MKTKDQIKAKVAAKVAKAKDKIAKKTGKAAKTCAALSVVCFLSALCGCQNPAQRAQTADTRIYIYEGATVTFGTEFVSLAQSNETAGNDAGQTASPTTDVKPDVDLSYGGRGSGLLETALGKLSGGSGASPVPSGDCPGGNCGDCADGNCTP